MIRSRVNSVPTATACLLAEIAEARGKQVLFTHQSPQVLKALRETALVKSVESSNRIEGIEVAPNRLRPLVLGRAGGSDGSRASRLPRGVTADPYRCGPIVHLTLCCPTACCLHQATCGLASTTTSPYRTTNCIRAASFV